MCHVTMFQSTVDHIYDDGLIDCKRPEFLGRNERICGLRGIFLPLTGAVSVGPGIDSFSLITS